MHSQEVRNLAIDQAKRGGDPAAALALAVIYFADTISDFDGLTEAVKHIGFGLEQIASSPRMERG